MEILRGMETSNTLDGLVDHSASAPSPITTISATTRRSPRARAGYRIDDPSEQASYPIREG